MRPAGRRSPWLVSLWLLFATIVFHAVVPTGSPLTRTAGSAFSATTSDVVLAPKRKDRLTEQKMEGRKSDSGEDGATAGKAFEPAGWRSNEERPAAILLPAIALTLYQPRISQEHGKLGARAPPES